ncbi:LD-carboxypeptidase [Psychrobacter sp. I-STPA6b]|uniref:LD-carboxypeptidase n=1 Tax=Psychrobacter sp. I-STPA6b TaxID=2585718 RepID=UPI001D0BF904|nr:LD-carboxypeptidase [Psychrobacter sp. I-STPA6b]
MANYQRRQILKGLAATLIGGASGISLTSRAQSDAVASTEPYQKTALLSAGQKNKTCYPASISTRLFACSNVGTDLQRNQVALKRLMCAGFDIANPDIVQRQFLRFAGTDAQRASDLQNIATGGVMAPKLLLGLRGGYGAMRVLPLVDWASLGRVMNEHGTILAGFSDVTAVQCALLAQGGMSSLSAPMLYGEFGKEMLDEADQQSCRYFVQALTQSNLSITVNSGRVWSRLPKSTAMSSVMTGTIWGGNLSVVSALVGSPYLPQPQGGIVFLEDVGEQPYRIERMLYSLYLAGAFQYQQAIVLGAFSAMGVDGYDKRYDLLEVVEQLHKVTNLPVFMGLPFGHVANKFSFPLGARCTLTCLDNESFKLEFANYPTIDSRAVYTEALWMDSFDLSHSMS